MTRKKRWAKGTGAGQQSLLKVPDLEYDPGDNKTPPRVRVSVTQNRNRDPKITREESIKGFINDLKSSQFEQRVEERSRIRRLGTFFSVTRLIDTKETGSDDTDYTRSKNFTKIKGKD